MRLVVDTSALISLAWSGQLALIRCLPATLAVIDSVYRESVTEGLALGHPDAAAIDSVIGSDRCVERMSDPDGRNVDERVVAAAKEVGGVVTNDQTLGRRAQNAGARWLRTADLVLLALRADRIQPAQAMAAIHALHTAGRITDGLRTSYIAEIK